MSRFVKPETVRIAISEGDWIDVKKELSVGERKRMQAAAFQSVSNVPGITTDVEDADPKLNIDWGSLSIARVCEYLVAWSFVDDDGKGVAISRSSVEALNEETFDEIDDAIKSHQDVMAKKKKPRNTKSAPKPKSK